MSAVRIPQLQDIAYAVELYYSRLDLSNDDIKQLFGEMGSAKMAQLKRIADDKRREMGVAVWSASRVPTVCAYAAWGLDIAKLEKRLRALEKIRGKRNENIQRL